MTSANGLTFRPAIPSDLPAIAALLSQAFKTTLSAPSLVPALMDWKYWTPRSDWSEPRAWALEKNGQIVAFAGVCPMVFQDGENAIRGIHMIDWAASADSPGVGITLVRKLAEMFDFILAIGGSEATRKVLPAFGFRECAQAWFAARPLRPILQMATHQTRNWKLAPRLVRNALWTTRGAVASSMTTRGTVVSGFRTRPIAPSGVHADWLPAPASEALFAPRSPAFFDYLLGCPGAPFSLHTIETESGAQEGCFALSVVRHQARIAGTWLNNPRPITFRAAYSLAKLAAAKLSGAAEIALTGTGDVTAAAATEAGFRILGHKPVLLLNRTKRFQFSPEFQFQLSEDDEAWLDTGSPAYWT